MNQLFAVIETFSPWNEQEKVDRVQMMELIKKRPQILTREDSLTHFTASAWVMNPERDKALMVYHNIYQAWSWVGGHADGEGDLFSVACRELAEETGVTDALPIQRTPVSLEFIGVQAHEKRGRYVAPHVHLNLTYFFEAAEDVPLRMKADENSGVMWRSVEDILADHTEPHMLVIYKKLLEKLL